MAGHLGAKLPAGLDQVPDGSHWTSRQLLAHLLECASGVCAVLAAGFPDRLSHFSCLRDLPKTAVADIDDFRARLEVYRTHIREGFGLLDDQALARFLPTVFVPKGETLLTLLLGNLEHLINHKHQLFAYARAFGAELTSRDLYRFRG